MCVRIKGGATVWVSSEKAVRTKPQFLLLSKALPKARWILSSRGMEEATKPGGSSDVLTGAPVSLLQVPRRGRAVPPLLSSLRFVCLWVTTSQPEDVCLVPA